MTINVLGEKIEVVQCTRCQIPTYITPDLLRSHKRWHRQAFLAYLGDVSDERMGSYRLKGQAKAKGGWKGTGGKKPTTYGGHNAYSHLRGWQPEDFRIDEVLPGRDPAFRIEEGE
jgi:hypothetical protein